MSTGKNLWQRNFATAEGPTVTIGKRKEKDDE
jgi:hypothetical protein